MPTFDHYMKQYDHEHHNAWNKLLHAVGIPIIVVGIVLLILLRWQWGLALFVAGWALLFLGHKIEGNKPAFFQGALYLLVGPLWVAKEIKEFLLGKQKASPASDS